MSVCKNPNDSFVNEQLRWVATLSNKEKIYQDDGRPGCFPPSAWLRLKLYLQENNLYITGMLLQFRSHIINIGHNYQAYFFSKGVGACMMMSHQDGYSSTLNYFLVGYKDNHQVYIKKYQVPELIEVDSLTRTVENCKNSLLPGNA